MESKKNCPDTTQMKCLCRIYSTIISFVLQFFIVVFHVLWDTSVIFTSNRCLDLHLPHAASIQKALAEGQLHTPLMIIYYWPVQTFLPNVLYISFSGKCCREKYLTRTMYSISTIAKNNNSGICLVTQTTVYRFDTKCGIWQISELLMYLEYIIFQLP